MSLSLPIDLYQITMVAGYLRRGMDEQPAVFDLYFRAPPFEGGYAVFAGLDPVLDYLESLHFTDGDLGYLRSLGLFDDATLSWLQAFRFRGRVIAAPEGSVVFGGEPILSVEAPLAAAQLVETALLNIVNFQTLIATKAARIVRAAGDSAVVELGARRAQGPDGALSVARAACIGGAGVTSNLAAGRAFGIPVAGTMGHSWVMAHDSELEAFRAYAACFPDHCVLLVDTYDTLRSGMPNALIVARELRAAGHELAGVRLDSGDLAWLSREARRILDEAGFPGVRVMASNELDEHVIESVRAEGGRVDLYGVGTRLATGAGPGGGALGGVYKLVEAGGVPRIKISSDRSKSTIPGRKRLWRAGREDRFEMDVISMADETPAPGDRLFDPTNPMRRTRLPHGATPRDLRRVWMEAGRRVTAPESLPALAGRAADQLRRLPEGCLRPLNPHIYKVALTEALHELREELIHVAAREA